MYETLVDATNLNQFFVRQPQVPAIVNLAPGLMGQVKLETSDTQYTSAAGTFTPVSTLNAGPRPAYQPAL
jgi:hypothetical protein